MKVLQMPCVGGASMKALLEYSWEALVSRSCKILSSSSRSFYDVGSQNKKRVFLNRPAAPENAKPACYWRFRVSSAKSKKLLLWVSLWGPGMTILVTIAGKKLLYRSWWNPPCKMSLHDLCEILVRRSWGDPVEIILTGPCIAILKMLCTGACMKVFSGIFIGSYCMKIFCGIQYMEGPSLTIVRHPLRCPGMRFWYEAFRWVDSVSSCAKTNSCCCSSDSVQSAIAAIATVACTRYIAFLPPTLFGASCRCNPFYNYEEYHTTCLFLRKTWAC